MGHFISLNRLPATEAIKGGLLSTVQTENLTVAYTTLEAGAEIPLHHHVEEAVDIILEGELEMLVGEKTGTLSNGIITIVPSNVPHKARAITDCKVVTIFNPRREL